MRSTTAVGSRREPRGQSGALPYRAPPEAEEALSSSSALRLRCWVLLSPIFLCLVLSLCGPSPKLGLGGDPPSGRDRAATFSDPSTPCGAPHAAPRTGFPHCPGSPSGTRALTLLMPFSPLCRDGSFLAPGDRWPRPSPRTGHCGPRLRKWRPPPRRWSRARKGVGGRGSSCSRPGRSRDRGGRRWLRQAQPRGLRSAADLRCRW